MNRRTWVPWLESRSDNPKSKTCTERRRSIENPKLAGLFAIVVAFAMCGALAQAQQPARIPRIGYVSGTGTASDHGPYVEALRQGLRELGYVEGKSFVIEFRGAEGKLDRMPSLVAELVKLKVDVLIVPILPVIRAAKQMTKTIPIVMVSNADPVTTGIVDSLARPGGNITGLATLSRELSGKRLELLKEVVPRLSRVGVLLNTESQSAPLDFKEYEAAGRALKLQLQSLEVREQSPDLEGAFKAAVKARANALITITSGDLFLQQKRIAALAIKKRLPSMYQGSAWVESGGLMSYSTNDLDAYRRAATFVGQNPQRNQARRYPRGAADQVRVCDQPENGKGAQLNDPAVGALSGG
jgi:putative ABC transport system substrate-binding protein